MLSTSDLGRLGEDLAASYLVRKGWSIVDRNWRVPAGEIDLVAVDGGVLVIVEVKTRRSTRYGIPLESITEIKARRLRTLAGLWLHDHRGHQIVGDRDHRRISTVRIDAIGVVLEPDGLCSIDHRQGVA